MDAKELQDFTLVLKGDGHYTIGWKNEYKVPPQYDEQVVLIGGPENFDLTGQIAHVKKDVSYLQFPDGNVEPYKYSYDSTMTHQAELSYGNFRSIYLFQTPFGTMMNYNPNGIASVPLYENGRRVMFWANKSEVENYWIWEKRGNSLATNHAWNPGENCVF